MISNIIMEDNRIMKKCLFIPAFQPAQPAMLTAYPDPGEAYGLDTILKMSNRHYNLYK